MIQTPIWPAHMTQIIIVIAFQFPINNEQGPSVTSYWRTIIRITRRELAGTGGQSELQRFIAMCCSLILQSHCRLETPGIQSEQGLH